MPVDYYIDHKRRLIRARGKGVLTEGDILNYQQKVFSTPEVRGYDELVEMADVSEFEVPDATSLSVRKLASEAAAMDPPDTPSKFAVVATDLLAFGLSRMFQTYRGLDPRSTKKVELFSNLEDALAYLGIDSLDDPDTTNWSQTDS